MTEDGRVNREEIIGCALPVAPLSMCRLGWELEDTCAELLLAPAVTVVVGPGCTAARCPDCRCCTWSASSSPASVGAWQSTTDVHAVSGDVDPRVARNGDQLGVLPVG